MIATSTQGQEISRRRTSNVCRDQSDCPRNAFCEKSPGSSNGQCICHHGFIIIAVNGQRECYKAASTIGDACIHHEQCMITLSTESECKDSRCQCQEGTHYVQRKNTCYKSVRVGDYCTFTNNCLGEGTVCRSGVCTCPFGKHANFLMTNCIPDVHLGERCSFDEECLAENSRCHEICRCRSGHIANTANDKCLRVANHMYDMCDEDHQCTEIMPFTKCNSVNRTCVCKGGYHEINYKCWVSVPLNGICEVNENCAALDDSLCVKGRCVCSEHLRPVNGICSSSFKLIYSQRLLALILLFYLFI